MKVLHILAEIKYSGAEVMLARAADLMTAKGFSLHVLSTGEQMGEYAPLMEKAGYTCFNIPFAKSPSFFIDLYNYLKKGRFDVIHIHAERASVWVTAIAKLAGCMVIVRTYHSSFTFKGSLRARRIWTRWLTRTMGIRNIAIGDSVAEIEKSNLLNPCTVVYNWTDDSKFYPASSDEEVVNVRKHFSVPDGSFVISSVGSCNSIKRHDLIIRAVKAAVDAGVNLYYLHAGDGTLHAEEQKLAEELGIAARISFLGKQDDVRRILIASDLFLQPSEYEGFSISCLETVKCGIPALVTDVPGLRDIVKEGINGYLCASTAISKRLITLAGGMNLSKEDVQKSVSHLTIKESVENMVKVYQQ